MTIKRFSSKYGIRVLSLANVGNHLHLQIKLGHRRTYAPFIRAVTGAIARHISKVRPLSQSIINQEAGQNIGTTNKAAKLRFWDRRPYTRIVRSLTAILNLRDYIAINRLQGAGYRRDHARFLVKTPGSTIDESSA